MPNGSQNRMTHAEFEALLAEAVDDQLSTSQMASFRGHAAECQNCAAMFADALAGQKLVRSLHEIEPPELLMSKVIAATSAVDPAMKRAAQPGMMERFRLWVRPLVTPMLQPRIAGSMAMAFFIISVGLNLAGVKLGDLRHADLRPSAVRLSMEKGFYETRARAVRYYESMRWVYQMEAQFRQMRNQIAPEGEQKSRPEKKERNKSDMSSQPEEQPQQQYYASDGSDVLAAWNRVNMIVKPAVYTVPRGREQQNGGQA